MPSLTDKFKKTWNAFMNRSPTNRNISTYAHYGGEQGFPPYISYEWNGSSRPDRVRMSTMNLRSSVNSIYNKIAISASMVNIYHVRLDDDGNFLEIIKDPLNDLLTTEANTDQTSRNFISDIIISMFDEGAVAAVPVETDVPPDDTDSFQVYKARVGKILDWYPHHIRVDVYDENCGRHRELIMEKRICPIFENPFYYIMNEPTSISKRLIRVLNQLDRTNESTSSGKIDLLIKLPYSTRSELMQEKAKRRRDELEQQLVRSKYGIGYIDASEQVIQLNRAVENNLWEQSKDLLAQLYNELGFSDSIFNGTANEETLLNYYNQTLSPLLTTITEEIERKWLSKTARSQKQAIRYFHDPFNMIPLSKFAEVADKLKRDEICTSNEIRSIIGMRPYNDPAANKLINSNLNHPELELERQNSKLKGLEKEVKDNGL